MDDGICNQNIFGPKTSFLAPKRTNLAVFGHIMGYRVTKWAPIINPKVKKVVLRCDQEVILVGWIDPSDDIYFWALKH